MYNLQLRLGEHGGQDKTRQDRTGQDLNGGKGVMLMLAEIILAKKIGGLIKIIITIKATADAIMDRDCNLPAVRGRPRPVDLNTAANCAIDQVIK